MRDGLQCHQPADEIRHLRRAEQRGERRHRRRVEALPRGDRRLFETHKVAVGLREREVQVRLLAQDAQVTPDFASADALKREPLGDRRIRFEDRPDELLGNVAFADVR